MLRKPKKPTRSTQKPLHKVDNQLPFIEHIHELKRRLLYVVVSVSVFGTAAYFVQQHIVSMLLAPAEGQKMIYTTPGGGLDFLFRVCIYTGIIFSLPVIIYQFLKYLEPLLGPNHVNFALKGSAVSGVLAFAGILFGYFAGMPAALHFLFHQFTTTQITPMITIQSYMHFVSIYMFGAALLFQVPLIMICINRIKPLTPSKLFKFERWMVLTSFVLAVIMNPTPNVVDQVMLAGPMILMYQVGIGMIYLINKSNQPKRRSKKVRQLLEQDAALRAERESRLASAKAIWQQATEVADNPASVQAIVARTAPTPAPAPAAAPTVAPTTLQRSASSVSRPVVRPSVGGRSGKYVDSFRPVRRATVAVPAVPLQIIPRFE